LAVALPGDIFMSSIAYPGRANILNTMAIDITNIEVFI
jgi:hypothetical protein